MSDVIVYDIDTVIDLLQMDEGGEQVNGEETSNYG